MRNPYNLWRTVKTESHGVNGYSCTRCGALEFPASRSERLRHRCNDSEVAYFQAWIKQHGSTWD
jgi:hypothetical protein